MLIANFYNKLVLNLFMQHIIVLSGLLLSAGGLFSTELTKRLIHDRDKNDQHSNLQRTE
jgi:hypothetical protein